MFVIKKSAMTEIEEILEKSLHRDMSKNHWEVITDKNGHRKKVLKRNQQQELSGEFKKKHINENSGLFRVTFNGGKFRNGENGMQPVKEMSKAWEMAGKDHSNLVNNVTKVGNMFNLPENQIVTRPSLKGMNRAMDKLREDAEIGNGEYDKNIFDISKGKNKDDPNCYNAETLRDIDGATLAFNSFSDLEKCLKHYSTQGEIIRIKNNFAKPSPVHYSDINMNIRLPNGTVSEIQLNTVANIVAKETYGHAFYEVWRSPKMKDPKYDELKKLCTQAQQTLYSKARDFSLKENFPDLKGQNPFAHVTNETYNNICKPYVTKARALVEQAYKEGAIDDTTKKHFDTLVKTVNE